MALISKNLPAGKPIKFPITIGLNNVTVSNATENLGLITIFQNGPIINMNFGPGQTRIQNQLNPDTNGNVDVYNNSTMDITVDISLQTS